MKIYCTKCKKCIKFLNPKISYIFDKTLVLSIIYSKFGDNNYRIIEEEKSLKYSKAIGLVQERFLVYLINMLGKKINQ